MQYPFSDAASLTSQAANLTIPNAVFVDACLYPAGGRAPQFLSLIDSDALNTYFTISDASGQLAQGVRSKTDTGDIITLLDMQKRPAGVLVVDPQQMQIIRDWKSVKFQITETPFCASVTVPMQYNCVQALQVGSSSFSGDVWLVGGPGAVWSNAGGIPRLDIVGDPYYQRRTCQTAGQTFKEPACFKSLNQVTPGAAGDVALVTGFDIRGTDSVLCIDTTAGNIHFYLAGA